MFRPIFLCVLLACCTGCATGGAAHSARNAADATLVQYPDRTGYVVLGGEGFTGRLYWNTAGAGDGSFTGWWIEGRFVRQDTAYTPAAPEVSARGRYAVVTVRLVAQEPGQEAPQEAIETIDYGPHPVRGVARNQPVAVRILVDEAPATPEG